MVHAMHSRGLGKSLKHVLEHVSISLLAVGIAFSLPSAAQYILFSWWPQVEASARMMLITELVFAVALVLLFNVSKIAWENRRVVKCNAIASLVHARETDDWLSRRAERELRKGLIGARDVSLMSVTGHDLLSAGPGWLKQTLESCLEIRVMLLNPLSEVARARAQLQADPDDAGGLYRQEVKASIAELNRLRALGKKVTLKFYEDPPFFCQLTFAGDHMWVRNCYEFPDRRSPEYVFALQRDNPCRGFYAPFFVYFLNQWNNPRHAEYDFDAAEFVYRNGSETRRVDFIPKSATQGSEGDSSRQQESG